MARGKTEAREGVKTDAVQSVAAGVVKKTFLLPVDVAFGLKRLAGDESERQQRRVTEVEIVEGLLRERLGKPAKRA